MVELAVASVWVIFILLAHAQEKHAAAGQPAAK
jgi:hypothetical protein